MRPIPLLLAAAIALTAVPAVAAPSLLVDAATGDILFANEATESWHPASLTKLMTAHLALMAVKQGTITMDTPVVMSANAAAEPPSKLGLPVGHALRLEDALRIMLVRSMNDVATAIGETVAGSEEAFVQAMNAEARRLGMSGTRFVNANGLHDDRQVSNARDLAVLAMAVLRYHSDRSDLFRTPFVTMNGKRHKNTNNLLGEYPGVDGMKTGYVCASGFNLVASAKRNGRRLVSVVLGSPNVRERAGVTRALLDYGFSGGIAPSGNLRTVKAEGPDRATDLRDAKCGKAVRTVRGRIPPAEGGEPPAPAPAKVKAASAKPTARVQATKTVLPPRSPTKAPIPPKAPVQRF